MKKVLILAYDFPPYVSVGGLRPHAWYKYLKEFEVKPIVVTRQWKNTNGSTLDYIAASESKDTIIERHDYGTVIRAPYFPSLSNKLYLKHGEKKVRWIRKSLTATDEIRQFIIPSGPKSTVYKAAREFLKNNKVDAIIATGEPFVLFYFAKKLSQEFGIPWIADYRDPWSSNVERNTHGKLLIPLEKKIVSTAKVITTVGASFKVQIQHLFPNKNIYILPNGYDDEILPSISKISQQTEELTISFVGTLYDWHPWRSFLKVLDEFLNQNPRAKIRMNWYGINKEKELKDYLTSLSDKTKDSVHIFPKMENKKLMETLAKDNVVLLFNYYSFMGTKIYDYLAIQRKILFCYQNEPKALALKQQYYKTTKEEKDLNQNLQAELIEKTNAGIVIQNEAHLQQVFQELLDEFNANGSIACDTIDIENYSRKIQVKKLAEIIKSHN